MRDPKWTVELPTEGESLFVERLRIEILALARGDARDGLDRDGESIPLIALSEYRDRPCRQVARPREIALKSGKFARDREQPTVVSKFREPVLGEHAFGPQATFGAQATDATG